MINNLPADAEDGFNPWARKIPHAAEQHVPQLLKLCSRAREPQLLRPCATNTKACVPQREAMQWVIGTLQLKELLLASTREKSMQPWRPCIAKYKQINKKYFKKIIDIKEKKEKTFIAFYTTLGPRSNSLQVLNHPSTLGLIKDFSLNFFRSLLPSSSDNSVRLVLYKKLLIP